MGLKNFFIDKGFKYVFGKLDGKKTIIGLACYALSAIMGALKLYAPESYVPVPETLQGILEYSAYVFGGAGVMHKVVKAVKK